MTPTYWNRLWICGLAFFAALFTLLSMFGCARTPHEIALPTVAAVRAPVAAAQVQVRRAVAIGKQEQALAVTAVAKGIAAGSEEARELATLAVAHAAADTGAQDQLTAALYQAGTLQSELDAAQHKVDAVTKDDAAKTVEVGVLHKLLRRWKAVVLGLVVADYFAGAPIQRGMQAAVRLMVRVALAVGKHLLALWPVILAAL